MKPYPEHIDGSRVIAEHMDGSRVTVPEFQRGGDDFLVAMECDDLRKRYERGEAFAILQAHAVAVQAGYTPPAWALEGLSEAFAQCLDPDDPQSLDTMFGLKAPGKGRQHPIKEKAKRWKRWWRAFEIHRLIGCLDVKPDEAARMLLWREEGEYAAADIGKINWLVEDWRDNYSHQWKSPKEAVRAIGKPDKVFFDSFPRESWPKKALVQYLRDQYTRRVPT